MTQRLFEAFQRQAAREDIEKLNEQRMELASSEQLFQTKERMCGINRESYPLPELRFRSGLMTPPAQGVATAAVTPPVFRNVASETGLDHNYQIASGPQLHRFARINHLCGAAFDYDLDGSIDLYLAQGSDLPT